MTRFSAILEHHFRSYRSGDRLNVNPLEPQRQDENCLTPALQGRPVSRSVSLDQATASVVFDLPLFMAKGGADDKAHRCGALVLTSALAASGSTISD
jgi:hypothetical protein